jgi:hypothetical protein
MNYVLNVYDYYKQMAPCPDNGNREMTRYETHLVKVKIAKTRGVDLSISRFITNDVLNVNRRGFAFLAARSIKPGERIRCSIYLENVFRLTTYGVIVHATPSENGVLHGVKIDIDQHPKEDREFIQIALEMLETEVQYTWHQAPQSNEH